jgi:hypothetical protein
MDQILNQIFYQQATNAKGYKLFYADEEEQDENAAEEKGEVNAPVPATQTAIPQQPVVTAPTGKGAPTATAAPTEKGKEPTAPVDTVDTGKPTAGGQPSGSLMQDIGELLLEKNKAGIKIEELATALQEKGYQVSNVQGGKRGEITVTTPDGKTQVLKDTDGNGAIGMEDKEIAAAMNASGIDPGKLAKLNQLGEEYKANLKAKQGK